MNNKLSQANQRLIEDILKSAPDGNHLLEKTLTKVLRKAKEYRPLEETRAYPVNPAETKIERAHRVVKIIALHNLIVAVSKDAELDGETVAHAIDGLRTRITLLGKRGACGAIDAYSVSEGEARSVQSELFTDMIGSSDTSEIVKDVIHKSFPDLIRQSDSSPDF